MQRIAILSDTHGSLDSRILPYLSESDAIIHAGDIGSIEVLNALRNMAPTWAVSGNIDDYNLRLMVSETRVFSIEEVTIALIHIGGYPGKYTKEGLQLIHKSHPQIFISGHSHILKVMPDRTHQLLHINPGAVGESGWHRVKTLIRLSIDADRIFDLEVIEFPRKG